MTYDRFFANDHERALWAAVVAQAPDLDFATVINRADALVLAMRERERSQEPVPEDDPDPFMKP